MRTAFAVYEYGTRSFANLLVVFSFFYTVIGLTCICPPIAFKTFNIVANFSFAPSDNALFKLGRLSPVSSAILVIPIAFAMRPIAVVI